MREQEMIEVVMHQQHAEDYHEIALVGLERRDGADQDGEQHDYAGSCQKAEIVGDHALAAHQALHERAGDFAALVAQAVDQPQQEQVLEGVPGVVALEEDVEIGAHGEAEGNHRGDGDEQGFGDAAAAFAEFGDGLGDPDRKKEEEDHAGQNGKMEGAQEIGIGQNHAADQEQAQGHFIEADGIEARQHQAVIEKAGPGLLGYGGAGAVAISEVDDLVQNVERRPGKEEGDEGGVVIHAEQNHDHREDEGKGDVGVMARAELAVEQRVSDGGEEVRSTDQQRHADIDEVNRLSGAHPAGGLGEPGDQKGKGHKDGAENDERQVPRGFIDPTRLSPGQERGRPSNSRHIG